MCWGGGGGYIEILQAWSPNHDEARQRSILDLASPLCRALHAFTSMHVVNSAVLFVGNVC